MRDIDYRATKASLIAPIEVVNMAKAVLGTIDLDPYSTTSGNLMTGAARYFDREVLSIDDIIAQDWETSSGKRVFFGVPPSSGIVTARRLLHKTLHGYRSGHISQAIMWIGTNEIITRSPWLWDFPICIPFRRLRPCYWDDEVELFRKITPSDWTFVIYMPPCDNPKEFARSLSQFHSCFTTFGRVVMNQYSGEDDWKHGYEAFMKKKYDFRG